MVKINSILGDLTGSVGDVTIYRHGDSLVMRSRHNEVRRRTLTLAQLCQRARYSNASNLWNCFGTGEHPRFQRRRRGRSYGGSRSNDYCRFKSYALQCRPVYLTRQQVAAGGCVVVDVGVSHGTLVPIGVGLQEGRPVTDIALGSLQVDADTTVAQFSRAVVDHNDAFRPGDGLRFVLVRQLWNPEVPTPYASGSIVELRLDPACDDPLVRHVGPSVGFGSVGGYLGAVAPVEGGMAWVHVRPTATGCLYSTQRLCVANPLAERYATAEAQAAAAQSYGGLIPSQFLEPNAD